MPSADFRLRRFATSAFAKATVGQVAGTDFACRYSHDRVARTATQTKLARRRAKSGGLSGTISATGCGWAWRPAKENENRWVGQNGGAGSGEIEISHGASEAEQLFDPERA